MAWGSALPGTAVTINDSTAYTLKVERRQQSVTAELVGQGNTSYDSTTDFGSGLSGLYSDKTNVTFDNFKAFHRASRDPLVQRIGGLVDTSIVAGELVVDLGTRSAEAIVERFSQVGRAHGRAGSTRRSS